MLTLTTESLLCFLCFVLVKLHSIAGTFVRAFHGVWRLTNVLRLLSIFGLTNGFVCWQIWVVDAFSKCLQKLFYYSPPEACISIMLLIVLSILPFDISDSCWSALAIIWAHTLLLYVERTLANACRSSNMILRLGFSHVKTFRYVTAVDAETTKFLKSTFKSRIAQHFPEKIPQPVGIHCELRICFDARCYSKNSIVRAS